MRERNSKKINIFRVPLITQTYDESTSPEKKLIKKVENDLLMSDRAPHDMESSERRELKYRFSRKDSSNSQILIMENKLRNLEAQLEHMTQRCKDLSGEKIIITDFDVNPIQNRDQPGERGFKRVQSEHELRFQVSMLQERMKWKNKEIEFLNSRFKKYELGLSKFYYVIFLNSGD